MRINFLTKILPVGLLGLFILTTGGCIYIDAGGFWGAQVKYERTVPLSAPLAPGSKFTAQTHNGSIAVSGAETEQCSLTATITGRAPNDEDARKIVEKTQVTLESSGDKLNAKIKKPYLHRRQSVCVDLEVTVPVKTSLDLATHNGNLKIENINGEIDGVTHNGGVVLAQCTGNLELETHNGSLNGREISGDLQLLTHNGKILAAYSQSAPPVCDASIITHNGSVDFTAPLNFSAAVTASTYNGSITTDLPLMITGSFSGRKLTGTIGDGQGNLHLETHNGSINIR